MRQSDKDQAVSDLLTLNDFKAWSSPPLKFILYLRNSSINESVDVLTARYVLFLNYIETNVHLKKHCFVLAHVLSASSCCCLGK